MKRLGILFEHPEWQKPLFAALERRGVPFVPIDLKSLAFDAERPIDATLYFNQASPSAYLRGNVRAVPAALALMRALEARGRRVINGSRVFAVELSKSTQAALLGAIGIPTPRTFTFNSPKALRDVALRFPALLKPDQGGSGARIHRVDSLPEVYALLERNPSLWEPDNLLNLQELIESDAGRGIIRVELLGGRLLYAMRVVSHGRYNLCPSPVCNPGDQSESSCAVPLATTVAPVEFYPYPELPADALTQALTIASAIGMDVGGIEYLENADGQRFFYDINANSNLRPSIAKAFGFDPFDRVADFLAEELAAS